MTSSIKIIMKNGYGQVCLNGHDVTEGCIGFKLETKANGSTDLVLYHSISDLELDTDGRKHKGDIFLKNRYVWFEELDGVICCPNCGHRVDEFYRGDVETPEYFEPAFCPDCGQKLDFAKSIGYGVKEEH